MWKLKCLFFFFCFELYCLNFVLCDLMLTVDDELISFSCVTVLNVFTSCVCWFCQSEVTRLSFIENLMSWRALWSQKETDRETLKISMNCESSCLQERVHGPAVYIALVHTCQEIYFIYICVSSLTRTSELVVWSLLFRLCFICVTDQNLVLEN